jgi:hypothetical protein
MASEENEFEKKVKLLKEIFNEEYYNVEKDVETVVVTNVKSSKEDDACVQLSLYQDKTKLEYLSKCEVDKGGTTHLTKVIEFSKQINTPLELDDASSIDYQTNGGKKELSLYKLLVLQTGKTWYNKLGFTNDTVKLYSPTIKEFTGMSYDFVIFISKNKSPICVPLSVTFEKFMVNLLSIYDQTLVVEDLNTLRKNIKKYLYGFRIETVSELFTFIMERIKEICPNDGGSGPNCGTEKSPLGDNKRELISSFSNLINHFYQYMWEYIMYQNRYKKPEDSYVTKLVLQGKKKKSKQRFNKQRVKKRSAKKCKRRIFF